MGQGGTPTTLWRVLYAAAVVLFAGVLVSAWKAWTVAL